MRFWKRDKPVVESIPEPEALPLSGIERMRLEQETEERINQARLNQLRAEGIRAEIAQIEAKIGPDMQRLQQLKALITPVNPYLSLVNAMSGHGIAYRHCGSPSLLTGILGGFGL